ncbi:hypothetical protein OSTOST_07207 [Ostertagia ostertagi]
MVAPSGKKEREKKEKERDEKDEKVDRLLRDICHAVRPRGIGLIRLPFGVSDHRSGPYLPNLYIAGNKIYHRTQSIPDVSLPGQDKDFSGHAQLNPFTHMTGVGVDLDLGDSWGAGYALQGVNFLGLDLRKHYRQYAQMPHLFTDGMHQPFQNSFIIGAEVDPSKYVSTASALDVPIPGLNEVFDFQEETLIKRDEELIDIRHTRFSLPIPGTDQRLPFKAHLFERFNDVNLNFAHVLPSINTHRVRTDDIVDELVSNRANPTLVG